MIHKPWLTIVGMTENGWQAVPDNARQLIIKAKHVFGPERWLEQLPPAAPIKHLWQRPLSQSIDQIMQLRYQPVAVLATGDPLWFGVGATFARMVPIEEMRIFPSVSAFSLACARLGWALNEVVCDTLHGRPIDKVRGLFAPKHKILLLGHDAETPKQVAHILTDLGYVDSDMTVLEQMDGATEKKTSGKAVDFLSAAFHPQHVIAIRCQDRPVQSIIPPIMGIPDHLFQHHGKITKRETRLLTISALQPYEGDCLWDVGAGTGSVSIEWLRCGRLMQAFAIEDDPEQLVCLDKNRNFFGLENLHIIRAKAPQALQDLPIPQAIFIGGGIQNPEILEYCWKRLPKGGRLVANVVSLEGEALLIAWQVQYGGDLTRIHLERSEKMGQLSGWRPSLPVLQYVHTKK
ncbi:MAG: precorrin-6y C5,15-methyltransferase (decarboxylating) subunit CbiE [Rhodospirillaceae bacterium]|nr:precorrin-6y C5,15-methyltransferase (decarboxylating) subunit CbiE [Rhodospirillaceae bacterium]